jgi:histidyl-tRNA synthetase
MKNIHFWFLLTFDQKIMVYRTLRKNPKTPLYGHRDRFATFTTLLDEIVSYILPYDGLFVKILDAYKQRTPEATDELKRMYEQNLAKIATLQAFLVHLNSIIEHDPLIASSLLYYTPILWHFVSNNVVIKDIDVNKYYINGTPPIKNISFKEYPI